MWFSQWHYHLCVTSSLLPAYFFCSHNTKTTSWLDPRLAKKAKPPEECREDGESEQFVCLSAVLFCKFLFLLISVELIFQSLRERVASAFSCCLCTRVVCSAVFPISGKKEHKNTPLFEVFVCMPLVSLFSAGCEGQLLYVLLAQAALLQDSPLFHKDQTNIRWCKHVNKILKQPKLAVNYPLSVIYRLCSWELLCRFSVIKYIQKTPCRHSPRSVH